MKFFETTHIGEGLKSSSDLQRTFGVYRDAFVVPRAGSIRLVQSDCLLYKFTPGGKKRDKFWPLVWLPRFSWVLLCVFISARLSLYCCMASFKCGLRVGPSQVRGGCVFRNEHVA